MSRDTRLTEKNLNEARENWAEFMNDLSELSSYKEIEKVVSKWDNELIQEKLIWLSRILINSFGSKLKIKSSSFFFIISLIKEFLEIFLCSLSGRFFIFDLKNIKYLLSFSISIFVMTSLPILYLISIQ